MKIEYAIMSSDDNDLYLDFWEYTSKIWHLKFGIHPILLFVGENVSEMKSNYGTVVHVVPCSTYPIYIQSLFVRYWHACSLKESVSIISDIDMFPISKTYFVDSVSVVSDDKYVHLNPCMSTYDNLVPSCYHVAKGRIFQEVFGLDDSFEKSLGMLEKNQKNQKEYWFADEIFATKRIQEFQDKDRFVFVPRDGGQNGHRIDRINWRYNIEMFKGDFYWDAHMIRPVKNHKKEIENFVKLVLEE